MPYFRKKPIVVHAEQNATGRPLPIETLEGVMVAEPGDWIITGVQGERYPCKPDIFELTYEPVGNAIERIGFDLSGDPPARRLD